MKIKGQPKRFKSFDETEIYYEVYGTGFPIIMLHGNHMNGHYFKGQLADFMQHFQVILMDSRGQGKSKNNQDSLTYEDMARDIFALMKNEQIEQTHLLGYSDGANLAVVFASMFPDNVGKIVMNSGNLTASGVRLIPRTGIYFEELGTWLWGKFWRNMASFEVVRLMLKPIPLTEEEFSKVLTPAQILVGSLDFIKKTESDKLAELLPNGRLEEVRWMTHFFAKTNPKKFNQTALDFLLTN
ncbi:MAG: alpha/beta hydrolase [Lactobacillales bacterium]|nr:alpha/beta hydrolase [Lactobacillales bacterium]